MSKKKYSTVIPILIITIISFFIGAYTGKLLKVKDISPFILFPVVILSIFISLFVQIIIHEIGHAVLGIIAGYEFKEIKILNFKILKKDGKLKFEKNNELKGSAYGGQTILNITKDNFEKTKMIKLLVGGGLFNVIFSIITFVIAMFVENQYIKIFCSINVIIGIYLFIMNLVIFKSKYLINDGYWIYSLIKDTNDVSLLEIDVVSDDLEPKDFDKKYLYNNKVDGSSEYCNVAMDYYRYLNNLDLGDIDSAKKSIENIIRFDKKYDITPLVGNMFTFTHDIFYYYLIIEKDLEKAKTYYNFNKNIIKSSDAITKARALVAYELLIEKDKKAAMSIYESEMKRINDRKEQGMIRFEKKTIETLLNLY